MNYKGFEKEKDDVGLIETHLERKLAPETQGNVRKATKRKRCNVDLSRQLNKRENVLEDDFVVPFNIEKKAMNRVDSHGESVRRSGRNVNKPKKDYHAMDSLHVVDDDLNMSIS